MDGPACRPGAPTGRVRNQSVIKTGPVHPLHNGQALRHVMLRSPSRTEREVERRRGAQPPPPTNKPPGVWRRYTLPNRRGGTAKQAGASGGTEYWDSAKSGAPKAAPAPTGQSGIHRRGSDLEAIRIESERLSVAKGKAKALPPMRKARVVDAVRGDCCIREEPVSAQFHQIVACFREPQVASSTASIKEQTHGRRRLLSKVRLFLQMPPFN